MADLGASKKAKRAAVKHVLDTFFNGSPEQIVAALLDVDRAANPRDANAGNPTKIGLRPAQAGPLVLRDGVGLHADAVPALRSGCHSDARGKGEQEDPDLLDDEPAPSTEE